MLIKVGKIENGADFATIGEAILAVPNNVKARIKIDEGVYEEKLFCEKKHISLIGAGMGKTRICFGDGAAHIHRDGRKTGTFRSYTAFFGGGFVYASGLSIENTAGGGEKAGQAIAAYVETDACFFEDVEFLSRQDTLFCAPLPDKENMKNGFLGPGMLRERRQSRQYYKNCRIAGDVDFIFGGANAFFEGCEIISLDRPGDIKGYISAPSTEKKEMGFVFNDCRFVSHCPPGSVYLGRPWRKHGKCAIVNCYLDKHIHNEGWSSWDTADEKKTPVFCECSNSGPGSGTIYRVPWAKQLEGDEGELLLKEAYGMKEAVIALK